jgi:hypothetical protein
MEQNLVIELTSEWDDAEVEVTLSPGVLSNTCASTPNSGDLQLFPWIIGDHQMQGSGINTETDNNVEKYS